MASLLQRRLLQDIAEFQQQPYPRLTLHTRDDDLRQVCLVLQPEGWIPLHITVMFSNRYPLLAPQINMDSSVDHPNVFDDYICASILNTDEGYTPAYTLKGIAIQMLSFFSSESIEQDHSDSDKNLDAYRQRSLRRIQTFSCPHCGFDGTKTKADSRRARQHALKAASSSAPAAPVDQKKEQAFVFAGLPDELLLEMLESLDFAWPRIAELIRRYDVIRLRELQCFVTKTNFRNTRLGVGVSVAPASRSIESEFDLVSLPAYNDLGVRLSVHNIRFEHWLPLPLSRRHWRSVEGHVAPVLRRLSGKIRLPSNSAVGVLAAFMNDIVVRLNRVEARPPPCRTSRYVGSDRDSAAYKSTLRHASEKAIESYFHLFHLLLCLATANAQLVADANDKIRKFTSGKTSKVSCPNLGHLLVYLLISDVEMTEAMRKAIITEAITRNVVWMLDRRGANMPELSYLEPDKVSGYRLKKTFEASRTSYRLLMFSELFRRIARPSADTSLEQLRDELFDRHGAPPPGAALRLSSEVRRLHDVDNFPHFFREMGITNVPTAERFTSVLRDSVRESMRRGYSVWGLSATTRLTLRLELEPNVGLYGNFKRREPPGSQYLSRVTFFPGKNQQPRETGR
ncbi:hypothetical protein CTA2_12357 [Colletotrichum tanaceti]|uniref:UBC core domain-containing protein n=1 Tax=Colletotrichum tanaceti TaxID=1306861 RepID=A0A4U6XKM4_9PEZI|nr:hypothetical protein CTA2_12357 [Colletotrichum tanaceti]TKW55747.1 hypothetical protein CTA1_10656 [Colletotrichum tanaceti]